MDSMISLLILLVIFSVLSIRAILRSSKRLEQATNHKKYSTELSTPWAMTYELWRLQAKPNGTRAVKYAI